MHDKSETDRIVIVASGFGLWLDGRHVASARWGDVSRVHARRAAESEGIVVRVSLADGRDVALGEHVSGWLAFLHAASVQLPGMPPVERWRPALADADEALLYDRSARRRRP